MKMKRPSHSVLIYLVQLALLMSFLAEELTWPTLLVGAAVIGLRVFPLTLHRAIPQLVGVGLFVFAGMKYGRFVSPEVGLNILFSVVCLKLLEAKEERDWRMLTLGLFLLWSGGALFVKTPLYFVTAVAGVFFALSALLKIIGEEVSVSWRQLLRWVLLSLPVTAVLFLLLPRFQASGWTPPSPTPVGQIGFSEEARPGEVESLSGTGALAFHATVNRDMTAGDLYWRGATLSGHDNWNWFVSPIDVSWVSLQEGEVIASPDWIRQSLMHARALSRGFALPTGLWLDSGTRMAQAGGNGTWRFGGYQQVRNYTVLSDPRFRPAKLSAQEIKIHTMGISLKKLPQFQNLKGQSLNETLRSLRRYFQQNGFRYGLSPGKVTSLSQFFERKLGWCVHYASATSLLMRSLGHPTRLVSGYLGGQYNPQSQHWKVSEDDAHVWVEAWNGDTWITVDPTLWIEPTRSQVTGAEFIRHLTKDTSLFSVSNLPSWFRDTQMWVEGLNYQFLVWSEELDLEQQRSWAKSLNWNLTSLYAAGLWILGLAVLAWWLREWWPTRPSKKDFAARQLVWQQWQRWWKQQGVELSAQWGPERWRQEIESLPVEKQVFARDWVDAWEASLYRQDETPEALASLEARLTR